MLFLLGSCIYAPVSYTHLDVYKRQLLLSSLAARSVHITTQDISDLTNTFAYNYAKGGEVGNPDDDFTKAINTKLGRPPDGRPKEQGLKPVFDLEDAANITPIGCLLYTSHINNCLIRSLIF